MKVAMEQVTEPSAEESWKRPAAPGRDRTWSDERAFRALYDRHLRDVLHFLRFQVRDDDRPDVASRVFEIAARDLAKFVVPPGKTREQAERNWLLTIARNASASHRQQTRQVEQLDDDALQAPDDLERDTAAFDLAVKLLWLLPERQRTLYLLSERDGLTHEDIAQDLGMPLGTVKTQLRAAQAALDAAIDRLCARERTRRADYLRAVPLPFVAAEGLLQALRNVEEEVDSDTADQIRQGMGEPIASAASPALPCNPMPPAKGTLATNATLGTARGIAGTKLFAALAAAAIGGAALTYGLRPTSPAPSPTAVRADVALSSMAGTPPSLSVIATATGTAPAAAPVAVLSAVPAATSAGVAAADPFRTEGDAMQATRNAFAAGDFARALTLAEQHARRYPGGAFVAEREAIAIRALAMSGRAAEARARADRFRRVFPKSVFRGAVDAATGGAPQ